MRLMIVKKRLNINKSLHTDVYYYRASADGEWRGRGRRGRIKRGQARPFPYAGGLVAVDRAQGMGRPTCAAPAPQGCLRIFSLVYASAQLKKTNSTEA